MASAGRHAESGKRRRRFLSATTLLLTCEAPACEASEDELGDVTEHVLSPFFLDPLESPRPPISRTNGGDRTTETRRASKYHGTWNRGRFSTAVRAATRRSHCKPIRRKGKASHSISDHASAFKPVNSIGISRRVDRATLGRSRGAEMVATPTAKAVVVLAVLWLWLAAVTDGEAPSCGGVYGKMVPCVGYLTGKEDDPSDGCCGGARKLKDMARSKDDRQAICNCLKSAATDHSDLKPDRAAALPGKCGIQIDFPIGPDVDCSKI